MRRLFSLVGVLLCSWMLATDVNAQSRPIVVVVQYAFVPPVEDLSGLDDLQIVSRPIQTPDCGSFLETTRSILERGDVSAVISTLCGELIGSVAEQFPETLFITGGQETAGLPINTLQLTIPAASNLFSAGRQTFETYVALSVCGSPLQPSGTGLFSCVVPPDSASGAQTVDQLHFQAALDVIRTLSVGESLSDGSQARSAITGRTLETALGDVTFDGDGVAESHLPIELVWRPQDSSSASARFRNAMPEEILNFLTSNVGPASAAISKVCGTTCPSQCNGTCQAEGSQRCCSVASEDPPPN